MYRCPLEIVLYNSANPGQVLTMHTLRVVYGRSDGTKYIILGKFRIPVTLIKGVSAFRLRVSTRNWSKYFPQTEELKSYG